MPDEPREPAEQEDPQYEAPQAEELPTDTTAETTPGVPQGTGSDARSDRNLKTGFAEVDVDEVLAAVRARPIAIDHQRRR
jgi:hypothetical protein